MKKYTKLKSENENRWLAISLVRKVKNKPSKRKMGTVGQFSITILIHSPTLSNNDVDFNLNIVA